MLHCNRRAKDFYAENYNTKIATRILADHKELHIVINTENEDEGSYLKCE